MSSYPQRSITDRMRGAAMLDIATYEEVEADRGATGQAFVVVVLAAICQGIGAIGGGAGGIIAAVISAIVGWIVWSGVTMFVGTRFFGGTGDWGELLRTLGFAQAPAVLAILGILPLVGGIVKLVVMVWLLITGVVAIRQALDFDTGKAILTALVGWLVMVVTGMVFSMVFGLGSLLGRLF